jgi:hypothetical protein
MVFRQVVEGAAGLLPLPVHDLADNGFRIGRPLGRDVRQLRQAEDVQWSYLAGGEEPFCLVQFGATDSLEIEENRGGLANGRIISEQQPKLDNCTKDGAAWRTS